MKRAFSVVQIGDETQKGNVIIKFQHKTTVDLGFTKKEKSETYYMAAPKAVTTCKVGDSITLDMELFEVVERPFEVPGEGEVQLKWLHLK